MQITSTVSYKYTVFEDTDTRISFIDLSLSCSDDEAPLAGGDIFTAKREFTQPPMLFPSTPSPPSFTTSPNVKDMPPGKFPLKYAVDMVRGFELAALLTGPLHGKYSRVFPGEYKKSTYRRANKVYERLCGEKDLSVKATFIAAGHTEGGLWSDVVKRYPELK